MASTKITKGGSFSRSIDYALKNGKNKEEQQKTAELPATENEIIAEGFEQGKRARLLATNVIGDSIPELAEQFDIVAKQKPDKKEPVHKVSISLKPDEHLETHKWLEVAQSYLQTMGYEDCPFLVAQHREKEHEHIHIVTSKVKFNGEVVSELFEELNARKWARQIEEKYGLTQTPAKAEEKGLTRVEIEHALKSKSPPPKLILQESIKRTLETNKETRDFIDALHKQNISIRVKTNPEREIIGVSFGFNGRGFKGSSLGTKFTWNGLQKDGLNYEPQRDYERLEEASRRPSQGKLEPTAAESISSGIALARSDGEPGHIDNNVVIRVPKSGRFGGVESGRGEVERNASTRIESGNAIGSNQSPSQSIPPGAAESEPYAQERKRAVEEGNKGELRRTWEPNTGETQTARRIEPEIQSEAASAAEETFAAAHERQQPNVRFEFDAEDEYFWEQELKRQSELFNQSSGSDLLPGTGTDVIQSIQSQPDISNLLGAGTQSPALDGSNGINNRDVLGNTLVDIPDIQGSMDINQRNIISNGSGTGIDCGNNVHILSNVNASIGDLGDSLSDERAGESVRSESLSFSDNLRQSLNDAESVTKEALSIQDELEIQETEKLKRQKAEVEMEEVRILTMW